MLKRIEIVKDSLAAQQKFLAAARDRHLLWVSIDGNTEATQLHLDIAELFQQSIEKYDRLLEIYGKSSSTSAEAGSELLP